MGLLGKYSKKLTLRKRIILIYSSIVAISLIAYGTILYLSLQHNLESNIDTSLNRVTSVLDDFIISIKYKDKLNLSDTSVRSQVQNQITGESPDSNSIYKLSTEEFRKKIRVMFTNNPLFISRNYLIQINDSVNKMIWRSRNLKEKALSTLPTIDDLKGITQDSISNFPDHFEKTPTFLIAKNLTGSAGDSAYSEIIFDGNPVKIISKRTKDVVITVGYYLNDSNNILSDFFSIILIGLPIIILLSSLAGWYLSKKSLKPIDTIITETNQISISNLKKRLPYSGLHDEVGRLTSTINQMIDRLEKSIFQIKQFTSDASHELRTPLTILRGELELALVKQKTPMEYSKVIASALDEVIRLSNVVNSLLELSRADLDNVKMNFVKRSLSKLMIDICEDAEILADQKKLVINYLIEPHIEAEIDPPRIHQAVLNVIDNGIKYTPEGGEIYVELRSTQNYAEIIVRDNGVGISEEDLPKIFDRFYRIDKARSSNIFGVGLGLSIVQWIVKSHNGEAFVSSELGKGTEFLIKLPYNQDYF